MGEHVDAVDEWGDESFPASDAATGWQGPEEYAEGRLVHREGDLEGFLTYRVEGDRLVITHTEVPEAIGDEGIGGELVRRAVELAASRGLTVVPLCPFARHWLSTHADVRATVGVDWRR